MDTKKMKSSHQKGMKRLGGEKDAGVHQPFIWSSDAMLMSHCSVWLFSDYLENVMV